MKLCKDCKYYGTYASLPLPDVCGKFTKIDPVDGHMIYEHYCHISRKDPDLCSMDARYFEPKPIIHKKPWYRL